MTGRTSQDQLELIAKLLKIIAWIFIIIGVIVLGLYGYLTFRTEEIVVSAPGSDPGIRTVTILSVIMGFFTLLMLPVMGLLLILSLVWIYRAFLNLNAMGIKTDYSAGWAIGSYFVPLANLFVPYRAMRELFNRSNGEIEEHAHSSADTVMAWWTAHLVGVVLWTLLTLKFLIDVTTRFVFLTPQWAEYGMAIFAAFMVFTATYLLMQLVTAITSAQASSIHVSATFE